MSSQTKIISGIGEVKFTKHARSKSTSIRISSGGEVRVSLSPRTSYADAERFVLEKKEWIQQTLKKLKSKPENSKIFSPEHDFTTYARRLVMESLPNTKDITHKITRDEILVTYPQNFDISDKNFQTYIKKLILKALAHEAKLFLPSRTQYLADKHGFTFERVSVRDTRSRWGSCSSENNLSLNIHLMRLPEHLRDYVILHELCHTVHHNHSAKFWNLLQKVSGKSDLYKKELKAYHPQNLHFNTKPL